MNSLLLVLIVKSTIVLLTGVVVARVLRPAPAAARHLVWVTTLGALLLHPLGLLLPARVVPEALTIRISAIGSATAQGSGAAPIPTVLAVLWLAVSAGLLLRLILDAMRAARLVHRSRLLRRSEAYEVRIADGLRAPASWSFGSGAILLPPEARDWTGEQIGAAVRHETAHVQRRDSHWLLLAEIACAVYWFHPLVWYAARRLRAEQEHAADDLVLQSGLAPVEYAGQLVSLVRDCRREALLAGAGTGSMLEERVRAILDVGRSRTMVTRRMLAGAVAAALMIALPLPAFQGQRKIYKIGGDVTPPQIIYKQEPQYTPEAKDAKIEGSVLLSVVIDDTGTVTDIRVLRELDEGLDRKAVEALQQWQFRPATKGGQPVAVMANVEVNFRLL